jgi:methylated-DNA-[protein]-cysteine S-methyltransferase
VTTTRYATTRYTTTDSPIGELVLIADDIGLTQLHRQALGRPVTIKAEWQRDDTGLKAASTQLAEYFAGDRTRFTMPLSLRGSSFQKQVWAALLEIPYGETASYGQIAARVGHPTGARAVGLANGQNPLPIIVPCHRVIGADGSLVGYGGGLPAKQFLLSLEASHSGLFAHI